MVSVAINVEPAVELNLRDGPVSIARRCRDRDSGANRIRGAVRRGLSARPWEADSHQGSDFRRIQRGTVDSHVVDCAAQVVRTLGASADVKGDIEARGQ